MALSLGLPRMHKEAGERRDFLPELVAAVARLGGPVCVEGGIGSGMGIAEESYLAGAPALSVTDNATAWRQDVVLVLRSPEVDEYATLLRRGTILVSMLHFPTRPRRIAKLKALGCDAISLDSLVDDDGRRLVENTRAVGWNGLEAAFEALERTRPSRLAPGSPPVRVMVMGAGQVGRHAVEAAIKYGSTERFTDWSKRGVPPVEVLVVGRGLTGDERYMKDRFAGTDVLVDASQRSDSSRPLIPNEWIGCLPAHAVVCDLVVDPYVPSGVPPTVRSIEGIPSGNLDQWIFLPDDPRWSSTIPGAVPQAERRPTVTCYSWPGIHAEDCMRHYGRQVRPLLERIVARGVADLRDDGDFLERALLRASLRSWSAANQRGG